MAGTPAPQRHPVTLRLGRNPICRRSDRLRRLLWASLLVGLVLAAAGGALVGLLRFHAQESAAARQAAQLTRVTGTAEQSPSPYLLGTPAGTQRVKVHWTVGGVVHHGTAPVPAKTSTGDAVTLWLDRTGTPVAPPADAATAATDAAVTGLYSAIGAALLLWGGYALGTAWLDRSALRAWEVEWAEVEPGWTHRP